VVPLGSNGEFPYLSEEEKLQVVRTVVTHAPQTWQVIVGVGCETPRQALVFIERVAQMGAHAALVLPPNYYKSAMTPDALRAYYDEVAKHAALPLLIYNMPANTGLNLSADLVVQLAQQPRIIGLKDSSGNIVQITDICRRTRGQDFTVLAGSGSFFFASLCVGAAGGVMALANVAPAACVALYRLFQQGKWEEARDLQYRLLAPNAAVTTMFGVAGLKAAMDLSGYQGGEPRRPLLPLTPEQRETVRRILAEAQLLPHVTLA